MKKRLIALVLAMVTVLSLLAGCGGGASSTAAPAPASGASGSTAAPAEVGGNVPATSTKDTLIVAVPDAPIHLDPQIQASIASYRVTTQIFDRLLSLDNEMNMVPGLAESWDVVDETTTRFHLRDDVTFHDGEHMTAEDVKYSLERCIASDGVNYNYLIISEMNIIDDYTIDIVTKEPFNALLYRLTLDAASIVSKKSAEELGDGFNDAPVGAGPYKFVSWDLAGDVVLEAWPEYYKGEAPVKTVIFRAIPEALNRTIGLETGEVDLAYDLAITDLENVRANDALKVEEVVSNTVWYLGFNTKMETLSDAKVRQAIAYAVNPQDVIDIVFSGEATLPGNTMLVPHIFGSAAPAEQYNQDFDKAKALLAEAGYPGGFSTTLWCADSQVMRDIAVVLQDHLRQIGITVEVKSMEQGTYYDETGKGNQDLFILSKTSIDPDSMLRAMYHSDAFGLSGNRSFWATDEVDKLIDDASTTTDSAEAEKLYAQVQEIVAGELPLYPLAIEHLYCGMQANVEGFGVYPGKSHFIYGTYFT